MAFIDVEDVKVNDEEVKGGGSTATKALDKFSSVRQTRLPPNQRLQRLEEP